MATIERERPTEVPVGPKSPNHLDKYEGLRKTREFFDSALIEVANLNPPPGQTQERWERNLAITSRYYTDISTSTQVMAEQLGMTRQRLHGIATATTDQLWHSGSNELRMHLPIEELSLRKLMPLDSREKISKANNGMFSKVFNFLKEHPNASFEEVERETGISLVRARPYLETLRAMGFKFSLSGSDEEKIPFYRNLSLERKIKEAKTFSETQRLLGDVDVSFYKTRARGNNPLLVPITRILYDAGFNVNTRHFNELLKVLRRRGVPFGIAEEHNRAGGRETIARYYFTTSRYEEKAQKAFVEENNLLLRLSFRAKQIRGRQNLAPSSAT